jgi:putative zinc finger/helix-turn-helix YgiT family protein
MKSPLTGKDMTIVKEERLLEYRKEGFKVVYHVYRCEDTGEEFTDDVFDNLNLAQVYNQYRAKYGIPSVDEIKRIRENYGLSAAKMSEVLGFGANVYRQYEGGEIPSVTNGRLIRLASDPKEFRKLLEIGKNALEEHEYRRVLKKVEEALSGWDIIDEIIEDRMFQSKVPNEFNGYRSPNINKIGAMVKFFAQTVHPFTTALNKLMFYADFGHYKQYGVSISGLKYHAIQRGPVPVNYGSIYNQLFNLHYITVEEIGFEDFVGEKFHHAGDPISLDAITSPFNEAEKETLKMVVNKLGKMKTKQLVNLSHDEDGWKDNNESFEQISYQYAFDLKAI